MMEYEVRIWTVNAFPDVALQTTWAKECFRAACRVAETKNHFILSERMSKLVSRWQLDPPPH